MRSTTIVLFSILIFYAASSLGWGRHSPNEFLKTKILSSKFIQEKSLSLMLNQRCYKYFGEHSSNEKNVLTSCQKTVASFLRQMSLRVELLEDPSSGNTGPTTIVFPSELLLLIRQPQVSRFLGELANQIQLAQAQNFDLFISSLKILKTDFRASQYLAVLFQDISYGESHVTWLKSRLAKYPDRFDEISKYNIELLHRVIGLLREVVLKKGISDFSYKIYPPAYQNQLNFLSSAFYHYYVIRYTAMKMKREGQPAEKVFFVNFIFNYLYELFDESSLETLVSEPKDLPKEHWSDVWTGLQGALDGTKLNSHSLNPSEILQMPPENMIRTILLSVVKDEKAK